MSTSSQSENGSKYIIETEKMRADAIAIGDHSTATSNKHTPEQSTDKIDLAALWPQLSQLWLEANKEPDASANKEHIDAIAAAEASAKQGNETSVLDHLKKAGEWAKNVAEKLTIAVAAKAIEKAMGIP